MDLINYPLHLTSSELDYELQIRGVHNISNNRLKTAALRELLHKEHKGIEIAPKHSTGFETHSEITTCANLYHDLAITTEEALNSGNRLETLRCISRFLHLQSRLERLSPLDQTSISNVHELLNSVYSAIIKISELNTNNTSVARSVNKSVSNSKSTNLNKPASTTSLSDRVNALNFSSVSNNEGAVGGNIRESPRETTSEVDLTPEELQDVEHMLRDIEIIRANPFRRNRNQVSQPDDRYQTQRDEIVNQRSEQQMRSERTTNTTNNAAENNRGFLPRPALRNQIEYISTPTNNYSQAHSQRTVPINQWGISFSGDTNSMHLYDFLSQVNLYQRSEGVSDQNMFRSIVHLLAGRAKRWYLSVYENFENWSDVIIGFKEEFLPDNYDYVLLNDITNRAQKPNESFGEFITNMMALFKCLSNPLDEAHKLFIVRKNLLPKYAMSIAPLKLINLQELSEACRRIDSATSLTNRNMYLMPYSQVQSHGNRPHNVSTIVQGQPNNRSTNRAVPTCWNCGENGHAHNICQHPKRGIFCYKCGARGVITSRCSRCSGNGLADRTVGGPAPDPPAQN